MVVRQTPWWLEKGEHCSCFLKKEENKTQGATGLLSLIFVLGKILEQILMEAMFRHRRQGEYETASMASLRADHA